MQSTDENVTNALAAIRKINTASEIAAYVEGDTRATVINAAEAKIKALTKDAEPPVEETKIEAEIAEYKHWRYHKEFEPRIFQEGETIPEGWVLTAKGIVGVIWTCNGDTGRWEKIS
jgi:hypothetical protein